MTNETVITMRGRAFGGKLETLKVLVDADGAVLRVWDSVAGYFTTCHSLTPSAQRRARKLAKFQRQTKL